MSRISKQNQDITPKKIFKSQYYFENFRKTNQTVSDIDGRIHTTKSGKRLRIFAFILLLSLVGLYIYIGYTDPAEQLIMLYTTIVIIFSIFVFFFGWHKYRNPVYANFGLKETGVSREQLVSVIIPVYNQEKLIKPVLDSIFESTYKNIEVIVVDDGSTDNTSRILNELKAQKYTHLKIISQKNSGKRMAVAKGFTQSLGNYIVLVDSDSLIDKKAIDEIVKTFNINNKIGSIAGQAKIFNADKNWLTRCQDAWYDYEYNISKTCESYFGSVTCCSGCLASYRREAVYDVLTYWGNTSLPSSFQVNSNIPKIIPIQNQNTSILEKTLKYLSIKILKFRNILLFSLLEYDDSEDRALTAFCLQKWASVYLATAIVYTEVPEKMSSYVRQQKRWKKGYLRANIFASTFMWSKNPFMVLFFYAGLILTVISPVITICALLYGVFVLNEWWAPISLLGGFIIIGFIEGLDYKMRDSNSVNWIYRPLINLILSFLISWLIFDSILGYKKNVWLTR